MVIDHSRQPTTIKRPVGSILERRGRIKGRERESRVCVCARVCQREAARPGASATGCASASAGGCGCGCARGIEGERHSTLSPEGCFGKGWNHRRARKSRNSGGLHAGVRAGVPAPPAARAHISPPPPVFFPVFQILLPYMVDRWKPPVRQTPRETFQLLASTGGEELPPPALAQSPANCKTRWEGH